MKRNIRLLFYIYFLKRYFQLIENEFKFILSIWEFDYSFLNLLTPTVEGSFVNKKKGWHLVRLPTTILFSYYRLNKDNYWKDKQFYLVNICNNFLKKNLLYKVYEWDISYLQYYIEGVKDKNIFTWMQVPFQLKNTEVSLRKVCLIDKHKCYLHFLESIDLDSNYFDNKYNYTVFVEVYDAIWFVSYLLFLMRYLLFFMYMSLWLHYGFDNILVWICHYMFFIWPIADWYYLRLVNMDTELNLKRIYYGKFFRDLHWSSIMRLETEFWHHSCEYTTHITGNNGFDRYLWTYWSNIYWLRDKSSYVGWRGQDAFDEVSTQIFLDNLDGFMFQNEIPCYDDKYTFASYYYNLGKDLEKSSQKKDINRDSQNEIYNQAIHHNDFAFEFFEDSDLDYNF